jgi:hypothetical protein
LDIASAKYRSKDEHKDNREGEHPEKRATSSKKDFQAADKIDVNSG